VLPGWEDSVDVAAWLIDAEGLVRARPCRWPRRWSARLAFGGWTREGMCPAFRARLWGALWRVVRAAGHGARVRRNVMGGSRPLTPTRVGAPGRAARA